LRYKTDFQRIRLLIEALSWKIGEAGKIRIQWTRLNYSSAGEPLSPQFQDRYFSCGQGVQESEYVFFMANGLPGCWQSASRYCIGEIGFGTGLNFFLAREKWRHTQPGNGELHFFSFEKFPIHPEDLILVFQQVLNRRDLLTEDFLTHYKTMTPGWNEYEFSGENLTLHLYLGDALEGMKNEKQGYFPRMNVWFYDGFAPSLNPELWSVEMFQSLAEHSLPGTRISTFTAVGRIRRGLMAAGFQIEKFPGFARKREMIRGIFI
jgi:tRNA 5-methylaminomethyl-2-thiouridine biosynthesis bifunctional protein